MKTEGHGVGMTECLTGDPLVPSLVYPFSEDEAQRAYDEWGANCGPTALAVCLGWKLEELRPKLADFEQKRYMSPTMMKKAITECGAKLIEIPPATYPEHGLCRVQWHGPWTNPGANPKWAYWYTHWIHVLARGRYIFDCNGGWLDGNSWREVIAPALSGVINRANGEFSTTHSWEIRMLDIAKRGHMLAEGVK